MNEDRPSAFFDGSRLGLTLLRAGRDEWPSDEALSRTLTAIGAGAAVIAVASGAAAGASAGAKGGAALIGLGSIVKWLGMGAAGGVVVAGIAHGISVPAPARVSNVVVTSPAPPTERTTPTPDARHRTRAVTTPEPVPTNEPSAKAPKPGAGPPVSRESGDDERAVPLAAEVALVDRARAALAAGEPHRTLRELERYEALFPERRLEPEVLYLRMEAHVAAGHDAAARETAERSVRVFPRGPHAARARHILEAGDEKK
jgi:hypothetical protein